MEDIATLAKNADMIVNAAIAVAAFLVLLFIFSAIYDRARQRRLICTSCGSIGRVKIIKPGSVFFEQVLWLTLLFPGIFYTIWRRSKIYFICRLCGSATMKLFSSPEGDAAYRKFHSLDPDDLKTH